uniref:Fanconi anemia group I protein n=1 Tax=Photinus pyralis TaxID=7054 RepID=A0A1Y1K0T8_PHOPY
MEMEEIGKRIREYGQKRNQAALQIYVKELDVNVLVSFVAQKYNSPNFNYIWDYLMQSFTSSPECHRKRFEIVSTLLHELEKGLITSSQCNSIITRLCVEFPKFKPLHLIRLCSFCLECIQKGTVSEMCWKDTLPEILNVLIDCSHVEYNDQDMSGLEYKAQLINSLCMMTWSPAIVTSLASMFTDMPLTKEEHLQVVNKLGQHMEKLTCQELPAFVYQLLKLCRYQNCRSIYLRLQNYFGTRTYSKPDRLCNSESETPDLDIIEESAQDAIEVESTILFHIYQSASTGSESTKDFLTSFKNMMKSPEFILHPFQITVLLTISNISTSEEQIMDVLKASISKAVQEDLKKMDSCWFREMVPSTCKVEDVINQVIECSIAERYLVVQGLVQLAYTLLAVGQMLGRDGDLACERQWRMGKMILLKVIKKKRQTASSIITALINHIVTGRSVTQYIDCIYTLSQKMPLVMLENQSSIVELLEYLVQGPGSTAKLILSAILPLIKISSTIRDHLILLLRKSLYSRVMETKQMAVAGFLKLIKNLKVSNLAVLSQSSSSSMSSGHSVLTQVSLSCTGRASNVFTNEALCLEVLGILRRCFMQQAEIRHELYDGLYDAVCMNPELGIPVIDILSIHFNEFYISDQNELPPLKFSNITIVKDVEVKLLEPLGKLIFTIGLIVTKIQEEHDDNATIIEIRNTLDSLCTRMSTCELIHFELDDGTDLLDNVPESEHKLFVLKEALSIYEALIGYKICTWGPHSNNTGQQINNLFQCHTRLMDFSKNLIKSKKGDKKKHTPDETRNTQGAQNATHNDTSTKSAPKAFEPNKTILDFQTLGKVLHLLHDSNVNWTTAPEANHIKAKPEIHRHIMRCTIQLIKKLKSMRKAEVHCNKMYYNYITEIACILYNSCVTHFDSVLDFDSSTATLVLECFYIILGIINLHYRNSMATFLNSVAGNSKDEEFSNSLSSILETYHKLLELDEIESGTDVDTHKLQLVMVNTIAALSQHAPSSGSTLSQQLLQWIKNYLNNKTISNKQVLISFFNMALTVQIKFKSTLGLFESIASRLVSVLGAINEHEEKFEELTLINESSALSVYTLFCTRIKMILDDIDWIVLRLRSEFGMLNYPGEENTDRRKEYLKSKERGVCCQLCPIITIIHTISNTRISPGSVSDTLLKTITHLYSTLTTLTKYFILRSSKVNIVFQGARFEKVVRLAGKQLSSIVYDYIVYIEGFNKQATQNTQSKKKPVNVGALKSKVLRETRLIPKVVYEMEQFGKSVIQLSKKTQVDLSKFVGQGTSRDFRIKGLQAVLDQMHDESVMNESTESVANDDHGDDTEQPDSSDRENESHSAAKRIRRS